MPSYATSGYNPQALSNGFSIALVNNAASDTSVTKTIQFAVAQVGTVNFVNTTDKDATGQIAATDADGNYKNAAGLVVPSGTSLPYNLAGGWVRFTFAVAPTSGSLIASA